MPRSVLQTLDNFEKRVGYWVAGICAVITVTLIGVGIFGTIGTSVYTQKAVNNSCPSGWTNRVIKGVLNCTQTRPLPVTDFFLLVLALFILTLCLGLAVWRRRRNPSAFAALFLGFALTVAQPANFIPLSFGAWLIWRAFRLNKYGVSSFAGVSAILKDRREAQKQGRPVPALPKIETSPEVTAAAAARTTTKRRRNEAPVDETLIPPRRVTEASKRYTPKKTRKKR